MYRALDATRRAGQALSVGAGEAPQESIDKVCGYAETLIKNPPKFTDISVIHKKYFDGFLSQITSDVLNVIKATQNIL